MKTAYYEPGVNGRAMAPAVREVYETRRNRSLEATARNLGVYIEETSRSDGVKGNVERYRRILQSVWVPEKVSLEDYYSLKDNFILCAASMLGAERFSRAKSAADSRAMELAKSSFKDRIVTGLDEMVSEYSSLMKNCNSKIAETTHERDCSYEKAHVTESLANKEIEYADAFREREAKVKSDMKLLAERGHSGKVADCEKVIFDLQVNSESAVRKARHYARQNRLHIEKTDELSQGINYLRFLKGKYFSIVTQAEIILAQINSHEFNIANCLVDAGNLGEHNTLMGEAESVMTKQDEAQERSIDIGLENFGLKEKYSGSQTKKDSLDMMNRQEEKEAKAEIESMRKRRKSRIDALLSS